MWGYVYEEQGGKAAIATSEGAGGEEEPVGGTRGHMVGNCVFVGGRGEVRGTAAGVKEVEEG